MNDTMAFNKDIMIFLPTYNEAENIALLVDRIQKLNLNVHILVIDDHSTDGTGAILEKLINQYTNIKVIVRAGKEGIGSAHLMAIRYAYDNGYQKLITMDSDFAHSPEDVPLFLKVAENSDVVVGTRFERSSSLRDWSFSRKFITHLGHTLTRFLLRLPYDSSGGFRLYRLDKINSSYFEKINSQHYEFFFESLTMLHVNKFCIKEVPIDLSKRVYGHSKMTFSHMVQGLLRLFKLSINLMFARSRLRGINANGTQYNAEKVRQEWDSYWSKKGAQVERAMYDLIAKFYRYRFIEPSLTRFIRKYFKPNAALLHAGCGSGEVDTAVVQYASVTALDISPKAIERYMSLHSSNCKSIVGNIFNIDVPSGTFDGAYNLGVMEHFQGDEVVDILKEMSRVLKPEGKLVLFWPPAYGLSVIALHVIHFVLNTILRRNVKLHPDEPSKISSKKQLIKWLEKAGLELEEFSFGIRDAFTYAVVVARKRKFKSSDVTINTDARSLNQPAHF